MDYFPIFIFAILLAGLFSILTDVDDLKIWIATVIFVVLVAQIGQFINDRSKACDLTKQEEDVCDA